MPTGNSMETTGYFGGERARARQGKVWLTVSGAGMQEILTVSYQGVYRIMVPLRRVERMAAAGRAAARSTGRAHEETLVISGHCADARGRPRAGRVSLWFSSESGFDMLSLEFESNGQVSLPYGAVEALARRVRRGLV